MQARWCVWVLTVVLLVSSAPVSFARIEPPNGGWPSATDEIRLAVNDILLPAIDPAPYTTESGRVMVPLHAVTEALDVVTEWIEDGQYIVLADRHHWALMQVGSTTVHVWTVDHTVERYNTLEWDQPPEERDGQLYVPIAHVVSALDGGAWRLRGVVDIWYRDRPTFRERLEVP